MSERLIINGIEIPLSKALNPSFTRSITDIKEPKKRNSTYSKTVSVPNSKEANKLFDSIWDINSVTNTFNPAIKADTTYINNGWEVIRGYTQLKDIVILDNQDIEYLIVIYGEFSSLFNDVKNKNLTDLTGFDNYDHDLTLTNQNKSSGNNGESYEIVEGGVYVAAELGKGYIYPLIEFGFSTNYGKDWPVESIGLSIYSKEYWDRIHDQAGYTYEFLDSAFEDHFKHLIIPASPSKFTLDSAEIADREFKSNTTEFTSTGTDTSNSFNGTSANDIIIFTNEISDAGGVYDPLTGVFTCLESGVYTFSGLVDTYATFTPPNGLSVESVSPLAFTLKVVKLDFATGLEEVIESSTLSISKNGFSIGVRSSDAAPTYPSADYASDTNPPNRLQCSALNFEVLQNDQVYLVWSGAYAGLFEDGGGTVYTGGTATVTTTVGSWFNRVANFKMLEGNLLKVEKGIPQKVKQTDFLMNYIQEYNLFVDIDPNKPKHLLYAPRDSFYTSNVVNLDGKISTDKNIVYKPLGALDAGTYTYKHKDDSDYLNTLYSDKWDETYGEREIVSINEFNKKDKKTEVSSSPSVLADNGDGNNRVITKIIKIDESDSRVVKKYNWRTLYYGGLKDSFENWTHKSSLVSDVSQAQYPYAGHFDDPFNATLDINFGLVREVFYDDTLDDITVTDNNLYNKYHSKFIREITDKDSKLAECFVHMTAADFKQWSFRDLYYFNKVYFRLQEINGFNPSSNELTKCTFLKLKEVSPFRSQSIPADGGDSPFEPQVEDGGSGGGGVIAIEQSPSKAITQEPKQNSNTYNSESDNVISGDGNKVSVKATNISINGDGNKVYSGSSNISLIASDNNTIQPNLTNVTLINSSGLTIDESNVTYIDGLKFNTFKEETKTSDFTVDPDVSLYYLDGSSSGIQVLLSSQDIDIVFKCVDATNRVYIFSGAFLIDGLVSELDFNKNDSYRLRLNAADGTYYIIN